MAKLLDSMLVGSATVAAADQNMFISVGYVKRWGMKEALRELIQNAIDGAVTTMIDGSGSKKDFRVEIVESADGTFRNFKMIWRKKIDGEGGPPTFKDEIVGLVTWDPVVQELLIANRGTINKYNLLLGGSGSTKKSDNPEIIGRFGEGMKLAALSLCREPLSRTLRIETGGDRWSFSVKEDRNFIDNEGNPEKCLFYRIDRCPEASRAISEEGWTVARVQRLSMGEWNDNIQYYTLFQYPRELIAVHTSEGAKHKGQLLMNADKKGFFYVKDLHVLSAGSYENNHESMRNTSQLALYFGYNVADCELNRDRNLVVNVFERHHRTSCIIADVLKNMDGNLVRFPLAMDELNGMWPVVYSMVRHCRHETYYFGSYINTAVADIFWEMWQRDDDGRNLGKQPVASGHGLNVERFITSHHLSLDFYPYTIVGWQMWPVLGKSSHYISVQNKFQRFVENSVDYVDLSADETTVRDNVIQFIQRLTAFESERLTFKDHLNGDMSFVNGEKLLLSKVLLSNEAKLRSTCVKLLRISVDRLLEVALQ